MFQVFFLTKIFFCRLLFSKRQARRKVKKNPLKNIGLMARLNPFAAVQKRQTLLTQLKGRRTGKTAESKVISIVKMVDR